MNLYLIERGPRPAHHKAPYHPVIICTALHTAKWETGSPWDYANVFTQSTGSRQTHLNSWLITRWKGLDICYRSACIYFRLPDGTETRAECERAETLIAGAVWWGDKPLPGWLKGFGVIEAPDDFTKERIEDDAGLCLLPESQAEKIRLRRERA